MVKCIGSRGIDALLALHRGLHHCVVASQSIDVVLVVGKDLLLDALAEAVLSHQLDDFGGVFLLSIDPSDHLIDILRGSAGVELVGLDHGLADRGGGLLDLLDNGRIIKDAAGNLAMPTTKTEDEVQSRLLLDVVVRKGAAVLELLAGEDEALLIGRDALLVLDLGLDVVDGVGGLDVEGDGLAGQGLDENLCVERQVKIFIRVLRSMHK